ncbi:hypothetical protein BH23ACT9_BH23ACT9_00010 [soil metagenome]
MKPSKILGPAIDRSDKSFHFTADFLAAILTWGGIGWVVDRMLGTDPVFMVIGFIVGNSAGIYLLYIRSREGESVSPEPAHHQPAHDQAPQHTAPQQNPQSQADVAGENT